MRGAVLFVLVGGEVALFVIGVALITASLPGPARLVARFVSSTGIAIFMAVVGAIAFAPTGPGV